MSQPTEKIPEVAVKEGKMFPYSISKMKVAIILLCVVFSIYLMILLKALYFKNKRLDHIETMAIETEKQLFKVQKMDEDLGEKIQYLQETYGQD